MFRLAQVKDCGRGRFLGRLKLIGPAGMVEDCESRMQWKLGLDSPTKSSGRESWEAATDTAAG